MNSTLRIALGTGLTLLGIIGLLLPIMPGLIFLAPGLFFLSEDSTLVRKMMKKLESRFPAFRRAVEKVKKYRRRKSSGKHDG